MARPSIVDLAQLADFQTNFHWNIIFGDIPIRDDSNMTPSLVPVELNIRAISTNVPTRHKTVTPVSVRGHTVQRVGNITYDPSITLTLAETIDVKVSNMIYNWYELNWLTRIGTQRYFREVCVDIRMELLDGMDNVTQIYILKNGWISDCSGMGDLAADSGFITPSITISYDWFEFSSQSKDVKGPGSTSPQNFTNITATA